MDNYFSIPALFDELAWDGIGACSTMVLWKKLLMPKQQREILSSGKTEKPFTLAGKRRGRLT